MKVELRLPPDGLEGDVQIFGLDGKLLDVKIGKIVVAPYFYTADAVPAVFHLRVLTDSDVEHQRGKIALAGATGRPRYVDQTSRVQPRIYQGAPPESLDLAEET